MRFRGWLFLCLLLAVACALSLLSVSAQDTPGTVKYPTATDTADSLIRLNDRASSTLASGIDDDDTSLTLADASGFSTSGAVSISSEIIYYTGKSTNTLTGLLRGRAGTVAAAHSSGVAVRQLITSRHFGVLQDALIALQTKLPGSLTGILSSNGTNAVVARTITGTTNQVAVADGNGATANPVISLAGPHNFTTLTSNGVLYGNGTGAIQATSQGAANSVLTANAGAPVFSATPTTDRFSVNPSSPSYDLVSNSIAGGYIFGNGNTSSPSSYNVASGKQLNPFYVAAANSGEGKLFGFMFVLSATGSTQDSGEEPVRGLIGRVTNSGTGNRKTTAIRVGASGSGSNASPLFGVDADVTTVATTNAASAVFSAQVFGSTHDVASGYLLESIDNARLLLGWGSLGAVEYNSAAFRAWMATGSSAGARGFQQFNNGGTEIFYTDVSGNLAVGASAASAGIIRVPNNVYMAARNAAGNGDVNILKVNASNVIEFGANMMNNNANPEYRFGDLTTGWTAQKVDGTPSYFRILKSDVGEMFRWNATGTFGAIAVTFSNLGTPSNGSFAYCSDCQVTSGSDNTATSGGNGAFVVRLNGVWRAFAAQN